MSPSTPAQPWRAAKGGVVLMVRLTPKSARDEVMGIETAADGPRLSVKVRAIPDQGEANAALLAVLAKWLGVPRSRLELIGGSKSKLKSVAIEGGPSELAELLTSLTK